MPAPEIEVEDDRPPSNDELVEAVASDLTYVGKLCAAYLVLGDDEMLARVGERRRALFRAAIVEISLLFIRKTTEFFRPPNRRYPDNLHAQLYLPSFEPRWVIPENYYKVVHKAVGHVTVRGARRVLQHKSKDDWPIREWTLRAIEAWINFYTDLPQSPVFAGKAPSDEIARQKRSLEEFAEICRHSSATD